VPQRYLIGKPLVVYVAECDRSGFVSQLNQLSHRNGIQVWQMHLHPREGIPFAAELSVDSVRNVSLEIESLRIGIHPASPFLQAPQMQEQPLPDIPAVAISPLPRSLDGLRVLVVDDEADVRDFITAILEPYGIGVRAVTSAAAALDVLDQFHPDVLVSDIRMPNGDGYSLIRQIRAREAEQGKHLPAAAITAYSEEDREKAISAGFEAHLHKLAQPIEFVELVAQLAGRVAN
jgi:CheY-like chemotaxis protein